MASRCVFYPSSSSVIRSTIAERSSKTPNHLQPFSALSEGVKKVRTSKDLRINCPHSTTFVQSFRAVFGAPAHQMCPRCNTNRRHFDQDRDLNTPPNKV